MDRRNGICTHGKNVHVSCHAVVDTVLRKMTLSMHEIFNLIYTWIKIKLVTLSFEISVYVTIVVDNVRNVWDNARFHTFTQLYQKLQSVRNVESCTSEIHVLKAKFLLHV